MQQSFPLLVSYHVSHQAVFSSFLSDDSKQYDATTATHVKRIIELLQNRKICFSVLSTIWESTDECAEQYICETALYLLSILAHSYNIIINRGVGETVYVREVVDGLNATEIRFL